MKAIITVFLNENNLRVLVGTLLFLIPASAVVVNHGASYPHGVLSLLALAIFPFYRNNQPLSAEEKILLLCFLLFSAWPFVSWFLGDSGYFGTKSLGVYVRWFMFIPVYFIFRRLRLSINWFMYALIAGAAGAGIYAIVEIAFELDVLYPGRAGGATNPVFFGNLSLLMGAMAVAFWPLCKHRRFYIVLISALILGLIASSLSGSRGGWVAIPFLIVFLLWQVWSKLGTGQKVLMISMAVLLPVIMYFTPQLGLEQRLLMLRDDYIGYTQGVLDGTSLGVRFEVWQAAIQIFLEHPITGIGLGNFMGEFEVLVNQKVPDDFVIFYKHAHSEYLSALAERGLIGWLIVMSVFIFPAYIFYHRLGSEDDEIKALSNSGMCMVIGYVAFSLTDISLSRSIYVSFYSCCTLFIVASIYSKQHQKRK